MGGKAWSKGGGKKMEKSNRNMGGGTSREVEEKVAQRMRQVRMAVLAGFSKRRLKELKLFQKVGSQMKEVTTHVSKIQTMLSTDPS